MKLIEEQRSQPIEELLEELCERHVLVEDIAADLGIKLATAWKWLVRFGFEKRWVKSEIVDEPAS